MNSRRRRLTEGTEVLWSTVTYVPVILCAIILISLGEPILAPFEGEPKPAPMWMLWGLGLMCVVCGPLLLRSQCIKPLKLLAREIGDAEVLKAHAKTITLRALPYVPLMAVPVALLCISLEGRFFWAQLLVIIGVDHLISRWRNRPIARTVDDLMARPSGWSKK